MATSAGAIISFSTLDQVQALVKQDVQQLVQVIKRNNVVEAIEFKSIKIKIGHKAYTPFKPSTNGPTLIV